MTESTILFSATTDVYNNSMDMHQDKGIDYVYSILTAVTSGLSMIGGTCMFLLYYSFKDLRTPARKLLLFLDISCALLALGNLLGIIWYLYRDTALIKKNRAFCQFQSALTIYFSITAFFWTVIIGACLFASTILKKADFAARYMKMFHVITWIPPGVIVIVTLATDVLGVDPTLNEPSWCWIDTRVANVFVWQMVTGKFWEIVAYITTVILYTSIKFFLLKKAKLSDQISVRHHNRENALREANRKLTFVPLVFIICRIWGTLRFLLAHYAKEHINDPAVEWMNPLQGIGDSAQGFANFVLYCISTPRIRRRLFTLVCPSSFSELISESEMAAKAGSTKRNEDDVPKDS